MLGRLIVLVAAVAFCSGAVRAQLVDAQFKVPAKPEAFSDKAMFAACPEKPKVKDGQAIWSGGLELGLNGSDGNSDVFKVRLGGQAKRLSESNIFTTDVVYGLAKQRGVVSENKALFNARDEIFFNDSPWGVFGASQIEYDQFRAFDFRVAGHVGLAYQVIRNETTSLRTRIGAGASREVGGPSDRWVPEGLLGFDFDHKLTDRQRLLTTVDFYPDLGRPGQYRVRARAAYEVLLDPSWGLALRLGIQDRFDSNPGPSKRNDLDYFATLLLKF